MRKAILFTLVLSLAALAAPVSAPADPDSQSDPCLLYPESPDCQGPSEEEIMWIVTHAYDFAIGTVENWNFSNTLSAPGRLAEQTASGCTPAGVSTIRGKHYAVEKCDNAWIYTPLD